MEERFRGKHRVKLDGKGRASIPAGFRRALEANDPNHSDDRPATVFIAHYQEQAYLTCMTVRGMDRLTAQVERMKRGSPRREALEEFLYENVFELRLDDTHRVTMPRDLREAVGLEGEIVFGGRGDTFRIYSPEVPKPAISRLDQEMSKLPAGASPFELLDDEDAPEPVH